MTKIYVVGMGPGSMEEMTPRARAAIMCSHYIIGYELYVGFIRDWFPEKKFISTGMTGEVERCRLAFDRAKEGNTVTVVSSGDSGIYGMAGLMLEIVNGEDSSVPVEIIPGVTAASAAAALLGAPLMHDFAVISLSDRLTPWEAIAGRVKSAAACDFVICLYNPSSRSRREHIALAREEILRYRPASTPVGIVWNAGRQGEARVITNLEKMTGHDINMFSTVIVGNSQTYVKNGKIITPRGYST